MNEDLEIKTYIYISPNLFGIYLLNIKNLKNLYKEELKLEDGNNFTNLEFFLANNIFKIEKLTGKFIKNISLIIEHNKISNINFSLKKKIMKKILVKNILKIF